MLAAVQYDHIEHMPLLKFLCKISVQHLKDIFGNCRHQRKVMIKGYIFPYFCITALIEGLKTYNK